MLFSGILLLLVKFYRIEEVRFLNILVCIKQVPGSSNVEVDPVTGVLKRDGVASKMNPYDLYSIEMAMALTEKYGGEVETITMGPPQMYLPRHTRSRRVSARSAAST